jgi:predicted MFS family arabinose efflux permease
MGFGVLVTGPLAQWLIAAHGWRVASAVLGAGALIVLVPIVWIGARDPHARGEEPARSGEAGASSRAPACGLVVASTLRDALRTRVFWALWCANLCAPLAVFPVTTHQVAFAIDRGFAPLLAASIFGVMGFMSIVGRVSFGLAADRFGGALAATSSFGCTAGGVLALLALDRHAHAGWLMAYALLFGLGFGARGPIITAMASDLFAGRRFGVIYGALSLGNGVGGAIGPWYGGVVHDIMGSYRIVFFSSVLFCALGAACFWLARRRAP